MISALFTSDLHGSFDKYFFLFNKILSEKPAVVFIAGDLLGYSVLSGFGIKSNIEDFLYDFLAVELEKIREKLKKDYPEIFVILGNDDSKTHEASMLDISTSGLLTYIHGRNVKFLDYTIVGYSYVPPTPFLNKDWEKYDVSRFVDVGCVSPEEGYRSIPVTRDEIIFSTIKKDLDLLFSDIEINKAICLFHSPPYQTNLDRAALDSKFIDHAPLDVHVGSIAIKEFITGKSPYITMHGHIHESTGLTGIWKEKIGNTISFQGASALNDKTVIKFDLENPEKAELLK